MEKRLLLDSQREKEDKNDDKIFYSQPRFVHHLDNAFRSRLTKLYKEKIPSESIVLDLMSSWVSHLPEDVIYKKVIGHGMNKEELKKNKRLDSFWVQDLNKNQKIPLDNCSVDVVLMVAAWQYLQEPERISAELNRIIRGNGQLIVSFSNRAFWSKAPRIWVEGNYIQHINYIKAVLVAQGWRNPEHIAEKTSSNNLLGFWGGEGDPFYSVMVTK